MSRSRSRWTRGAAVIVVIVLSIGAGWYFLGWREVKPPEIKPPPPEKKDLFSLHGVIFFDYDGDGTQDAVEPPIPDVKVTIGQISCATNQSGIYAIKGLPRGQHRIQLAAPKCFRHICLSNETILPVGAAIEVDIATEMRKDFALAEGFLTLPFASGSGHPLFGYHDLDKTRGRVRNWKGQTGTVEAKPSDQPGAYHPEVMAQDDHEGIDFTCDKDTPVVAAAPGTITYARVNPDGGLNVVIDHGNRFKTSYGHVSKFMVYEGQTVSRGQAIALSGNTGPSGRPHLHFGFYWMDKPNPSPPGPFSDPYSIDPFRDFADPSSLNYWTKDNDPQFPHSDLIGNRQLCREDGTVTELENLFLNDPDKHGKELLNWYLGQLESNSSYAAVARELRRLPELSFALYGLQPTSIDMVEAVEDIVYLALLARNPEVREVFDLMIKGGTPQQGDFQYSVPSWNTELQVLYWLACQNEFKKDDTLALAIAMVNGIWVTIGDEQVKETVKTDARNLLLFFRETNEFQRQQGGPLLYDYPLEAMLCLVWTAGQNLNNGPHALFSSNPYFRDRPQMRITLRDYEWVTLSDKGLRDARDIVWNQAWVRKDYVQTFLAIETHFRSVDTSGGPNWVGGWLAYDTGEKMEIHEEVVPIHNINNPDFEIEHYLRTGKGIGVCDDQANVVEALCKSWGISTTTMYRMWGGISGVGHTHAICFDPLSKMWLGSRGQLSVNRYATDMSNKVAMYITRPPWNQSKVLEWKADPFVPTYHMSKIYYSNLSITAQEVLDTFSRGIASSQMKQWLLYS